MNSTPVDIVNQKPAMHGEVFESVHRVMHLFRAEQYRGLRDGPHALTHLEGRLLGFFARKPGATLRDLTTHFGRDKGQLARLIKSLKKQGLLRAEDNEGDRRSVRLRLTSEGLAVHRLLQRQARRLEKVAVQGLRPKDCCQLLTLLHKVRTNLEAAT